MNLINLNTIKLSRFYSIRKDNKTYIERIKLFHLIITLLNLLYKKLNLIVHGIYANNMYIEYFLKQDTKEYEIQITHNLKFCAII